MRTETAREDDYKNRRAVEKAFPAAEKIVKVCGGWMIFYDLVDYEIWRNQD